MEEKAAKKTFDRGDTVYVRAEVIGTITGLNSGAKYAVIFPDGKTSYVHEKDLLKNEPREHIRQAWPRSGA